LNIADDSRPES